MEVIKKARIRGRSSQIFGETCVQYFFFTKDDLARPSFEGAKWVCSPPYREKKRPGGALAGRGRQLVAVVSIDHCPFWFEGGVDGRTPGKG